MNGQTLKGIAGIMPDNGICERFHKTVLNEFYRVAFRKKLYTAIADLQEDLDLWIRSYNGSGPIKGVGALVKRRCKLSLTPSRLRGTN
jgi:hypothetical protein